MKQEESVN